MHAHQSLNENPRRTHDFEPLRVEGRLPAGLRGTLFRTGPGLPERFGKRVLHAFEADGLMSAVRFTDQGAAGAVQPVRGPEFLVEESLGRRRTGSTAHAWDRAISLLSGRQKSNGNTSMWAWNGELYALMEGSQPVRISADDLQTHGISDLGGIIPQAFSAHPHRVAALGTTFNFGCRFGKRMQVDFFALPDAGAGRRLTTVELPFNAMVHDFVATETHLVLLVCPAVLRPVRALLGLGGFDSWFSWQPERGTLAVVVPLDQPDASRIMQVDPFFFFHTANAWSNGESLTVDLCAYDNLDALAEIGTDRDSAAHPELRRGRLDLTTGRWELAATHDIPFEFPCVHPSVQGSEHGIVFGLTEGEIRGHRGLASLGRGGQVWMPERTCRQASEPVLVPRGTAEQDVWVLTLVHDDEVDRSFVAVLDGERLDEGPVARVWFDQTLPLTFHGTFVA